MLRMMLHQVFDRASYSKYYQPDDTRKPAPPTPVINCLRPLPEPWDAVCNLMSHDSGTIYLVKTHEPPQDSQPAIYIVRNGFAAVRSYKHFLFDVNNLEYSLDQVILGQPLFGSWGSHLDAWNPLSRPNTLLLKYEDLIDSPERELDRVQSFLHLPRLGNWINNFDELHASNPTRFRYGPKVAPDHGFTDQQLQLFSTLHGDWMARLDYSPPFVTTPRELRAILPQLVKGDSPVRSRDAVPRRAWRRFLPRWRSSRQRIHSGSTAGSKHRPQLKPDAEPPAAEKQFPAPTFRACILPCFILIGLLNCGTADRPGTRRCPVGRTSFPTLTVAAHHRIQATAPCVVKTLPRGAGGPLLRGPPAL